MIANDTIYDIRICSVAFDASMTLPNLLFTNAVNIFGLSG
jgi:hypothetical protein